VRSQLVEKALQTLPIQRGYYDIWGNFFEPTEEGTRGILKALRFDPEQKPEKVIEQLDAWRTKYAEQVLPPAIVLRGSSRKIECRGPDARWELIEESGTRHSGTSSQEEIEIPAGVPDGYHQLEVKFGRKTRRVKVIICPQRAFHGPEQKCWGLSAQLYSLYSGKSEGLGDFHDLSAICAWVRRLGGSFVGVNPLHALFPGDPIGYSPYSPSSRRALNPLYVHLEELPEFHPEDLRLHQFLRSRHANLLNYSEIVERKLEIFGRCFDRLRTFPGGRNQEFQQFVESAPPHLRRFAEYEAAKDSAARGAEFQLYCQWAAHQQLSRVAATSGLEIGLYLDLAVGVNPAGAEVAEDPKLFATGASAGAPPDLLNVHGQVWGLAPYIPWELQERGYEPFIETIRFNMQYAGALRIDHIMALQRLFWVPEGMTGRDGIYLQYQLSDLMGIVALESQRNRCIVIGEDLGTVPDEIRAEMRETGVLSYKVLFFMKDYHGDGRFLRPDEYPEDALVAGSTHDLPTLRGFLHGQDLEVRQPLGLFSESCTYESEMQGRAKDRESLIALLREQGFDVESDEAIVAATYELLARSRSRLQTIQIEDLIGELDQANLPGTVTEHPNWRRRLSRSLESICFDEGIEDFLKGLRR